ncbi:MAG: AAA family ATPase [Candidatus Sumerlaeia bacterium]|nr:AAA family ATPase [Candidatus Sumerlaeia bacterium]
MRFTRIELQNWKSFVRADVELARRTFIIGPNASGKSNFLDAFRFLRDLALPGGGLAEAVRLRGGVKCVRSVHARRPSDVQVKVHAEADDGSAWVYELAFTRNGRQEDVPVVVREVVRCLSSDESGEEGTLLLNRPDGEDSIDPDRLTQTAIEQTSANKDFRQLAEFFRTVRYLHLVPQVVREGAAKPEAVVGEDSMGRDLLDRVRQTQPRTRDARLKRIQRVLEVAVPHFRSLELVEDTKGRPHLRVRFSHWRAPGAFQDESQFSDGTLRLIGLLWSLQEKSGPLLLEEPELSLHNGLLTRLAPFIHRAQKAANNRQVILSTHSEHLLRDPGIGADEILFVEPQTEGSTITMASRVEVIRKMMIDGKLTAAEAVLPRTRGAQLEMFDEVTP